MSRFRGSNNSGDSAATLRRPTLVKKEKLDPLLEQKHIKDLYDLEDDVTMDDDTAISSDSFTPINLLDGKCMIACGWSDSVHINKCFLLYIFSETRNKIGKSREWCVGGGIISELSKHAK